MRELEFLSSHLPQSDLDCYGEDLLRKFAAHGAYLRQNVPWCAALEQELFDHYVLCPRVNDEDLSFYSKLFFDTLWERIAPLETMEDRVLEVNRWCGEQANYQMQDERTASPLTVYRNGSGRCGEESAFLVAALRSVGIPARQVYAPRWAHCDDNHAWVEAWCDDGWHFLGACEPEPVLDRGWFNTPASRALLVHSRTFGEASGSCHGSLISRENGVSWYNQTSRYARTRDYRFRVLRDGEPAPGAKIHIQVLNEAGFHTVASLTADEQGEARMEMGVGDFHVLAAQDGLQAEGDCHGQELTLQLQTVTVQTGKWLSFDVRAPQSSDRNPSLLNETQKQHRLAQRQKGAAVRLEREECFRQFAARYPQWEDLLLLARGNAPAIAAFLTEDNSQSAEALLRTLSEKDLRDVTVETLNDHLRHAPEQGDVPGHIYRQYVLCPRIGLEPLRPWRQALQKELGEFRGGPDALWEYLTDRVVVSAERIYGNLSWTPLESWRAGRCDEKSRKLLFVAALRSLGIPARLRPLDGQPEYWEAGAFYPLFREETGVLRLNCADPLAYRQNWTLSKWTGEVWKLLDMPGDCRETKLPAGLYRLITTRRMPNGNQYGAMRDLAIEPGKITESELYLRPCELADMLGSQTLPPMNGRTLDGREVSLLTGGTKLLLWLEEGAEPTEHLLMELMTQSAALKKIPVTVLLRGREALKNATLTQFLNCWSDVRVLLDDWAYDLEMTARCLTCDPDTPPLAVICDSGRKVVFGVSGYRVGLGKLLADIAAYIAEKRGV